MFTIFGLCCILELCRNIFDVWPNFYIFRILYCKLLYNQCYACMNNLFLSRLKLTKCFSYNTLLSSLFVGYIHGVGIHGIVDQTYGQGILYRNSKEVTRGYLLYICISLVFSRKKFGVSPFRMNLLFYYVSMIAWLPTYQC